MVQKQQVLGYENWSQIITKIKNKETVRNQLYHIYTDSLALLQSWPAFSFNEKEVMHKNMSAKLKAQ